MEVVGVEAEKAVEAVVEAAVEYSFSRMSICLECEALLRAFAYLTRNRSLRSISLSLAEYKSKSLLG